MNTDTILSLFPTLTTAAHTLHGILSGVCFVLLFLGLVMVTIQAQQERSVQSIWPQLVRLAVCSIMVGQLPAWVNGLQGIVQDILSETGFAATAGSPGNVFADYRAAVDTHMAGTANGWSWLTNPGGSANTALLGVATYILSWIAISILWITNLVQQILVTIEVAVSPIFLGCLAVPALRNIGGRFMTGLAAVCCWNFGFSVADLITKGLLDLAVDPGAAGTAGAGVLGTAVGAMSLPALYILIAVWVIGSALLVPFATSRAFRLGESIGVGVIAASALAIQQSSARAAMMASSASSAAPAAVATTSSVNGNGMRPPSFSQYARRPTSNGNKA